MNHKTKKRIQEFTFVLPALIMFLIFVIVPFIQGFPMSFTKWDGMSPNKPFVGFSNYLRIFQDGNVINATKNTLIFTVLTWCFLLTSGVMYTVMCFIRSLVSQVLWEALYGLC